MSEETDNIRVLMKLYIRQSETVRSENADHIYGLWVDMRKDIWEKAQKDPYNPFLRRLSVEISDNHGRFIRNIKAAHGRY